MDVTSIFSSSEYTTGDVSRDYARDRGEEGDVVGVDRGLGEPREEKTSSASPPVGWGGGWMGGHTLTR